MENFTNQAESKHSIQENRGNTEKQDQVFPEFALFYCIGTLCHLSFADRSGYILFVLGHVGTFPVFPS